MTKYKCIVGYCYKYACATYDWFCPGSHIHIYIHTVLSVNEYTPFEKLNFKQYLNEHKNHFQNVDKTKFNITSV